MPRLRRLHVCFPVCEQEQWQEQQRQGVYIPAPAVLEMLQTQAKKTAKRKIYAHAENIYRQLLGKMIKENEI